MVRITLAFVLASVPAVAMADKTFTKGTGETWDCTKDPVVTIKTAKGTYGFLGECKRVTITGSKNAVSIATTAKLIVSGSDNLIDADQVDAIVVNGAKNKVTWKKTGTSGKPKVTLGNKSSHVDEAK